MRSSFRHWIQIWNNRRKRFFAHARRYGRGRAASLLLHRLTLLPLVRSVLRWHLREIFVVRASEMKLPSRVPGNYQIRLARRSDESALSEYFGSADRIRERFDRGDFCLIACCREGIGAAVWFAPGPANYIDDWKDVRCRFEVPAGAVWSYDGKGTRFGAWGSLMARLPEYLRQWGVEFVFTAIDYHNGESMSGHQSLGYRRLGMLQSVGLPGISRTTCKGSKDSWSQLPAVWERLQLTA
jgi:hypothetical protein